MLEIRDLSPDEVWSANGYRECFDAYTAECANSAIGKTTPNKELYQRLWTAGALRCGIAFDEKGVIVGGVYVYFYEVPHYAGSRVASLESIFLLARERKGMAGLRLVNWAKEKAKEQGCSVLFVTTPAGSSFEKIGERLWKKTNSMFCVEIEK